MPKEIALAFSIVSCLIFAAHLYLYKKQKDTTVLYTSFPFLCIALITLGHFHALTMTAPESVILWTKVKYVGIFSFLFFFPLFLLSITRTVIHKYIIYAFGASAVICCCLTFFTDTIISASTHAYGNAVVAGVGSLYGVFMIIMFCISMFFSFSYCKKNT